MNAAWSQVQNQYQRRADLVPNLVETVKGFAAQERQVLTDVVEARSKVGQVKLSPEITQDPEAFKKFEAAQNQLTGALSRLMVVVERYPDLKSNQNFLNLQSQLEGTENRIAVARRDYIEAVRRFNTAVRSFPTNLTARFLLSMKPKANFTAEASAQEAPKVKF
ncbi:MAG TPA: LemA family protein [Candidatus Manganitrophaceae bacterium]|nr:LemA family protein [Candidatus Manganitrophaceae bacterium]